MANLIDIPVLVHFAPSLNHPFFGSLLHIIKYQPLNQQNIAHFDLK